MTKKNCVYCAVRNETRTITITNRNATWLKILVRFSQVEALHLFFVKSKWFRRPPNFLSNGHLRLHLQAINYGLPTNMCIVMKLRILEYYPSSSCIFMAWCMRLPPKLFYVFCAVQCDTINPLNTELNPICQ